ncbi:MAG: hypothetical protein Q9227_008340 [Pyrenula ochraceoflavens]
MYTISEAVLYSKPRQFDAVFAKYFLPEHRDAVLQVFNATLPPSKQELQKAEHDTFDMIFVDAHDGYFVENAEENIAATYSDPFSHSAIIVIRDQKDIWAKSAPNLKSVGCSSLHTYPSYNMATLGGFLLLHELMHVHSISEAAIKPFNMPNNRVTDYYYGPYMTQQMVNDTNTVPGRNFTYQKAVIANADSYTWNSTGRKDAESFSINRQAQSRPLPLPDHSPR